MDLLDYDHLGYPIALGYGRMIKIDGGYMKVPLNVYHGLKRGCEFLEEEYRCDPAHTLWNDTIRNALDWTRGQ